ncbi:MAG: Nif3-like dinuclear metal center hexameric protein [bacterium]|nr:Nif3-like dinuclear metal center hexameric protein [bacterium]
MESLLRISAYLDEYLRLAQFKDDSQNGLQVEGNPQVKRIAGLVDASLEGFTAAADARADMIIVHHGLFWGSPLLLTGTHLARVKTLLTRGISLYAAHLPLDAHPEIGNNIRLLQLLGAKFVEWFAEYHGTPIGVVGSFSHPKPLSEVIDTLDTALGSQSRVYDFGPDHVRTLGIVSGAGCDAIPACKRAGVDLFITGEPRLHAYHTLKELELNAAFAGHYYTERLGIQALLTHLPTRFDVETLFIDVDCDI